MARPKVLSIEDVFRAEGYRDSAVGATHTKSSILLPIETALLHNNMRYVIVQIYVIEEVWTN